MSADPSIAVIIPTYNRYAMTVEAALSACKQSLRAKEVWVIDDGSIDGTIEYLGAHPQLQTFLKNGLLKLHSQPNSGVSAARNKGIALSKGDWLAFLDSDDLWYKKKLELQWRVLCQNTALRIVHCNERWEKNGQHLNQMKRHQKAGGDIFERSLGLCLVSPSAVLIHRSLLEEMNGFNEQLRVCEDYDLWLRIGSNELFAFTESILLLKRGGHEDQLSHSVPHLDLIRVQILIDLLKQKNLSSEKRMQVYKAINSKIDIMILGCKKSNKLEELANLLALKQQYAV